MAKPQKFYTVRVGRNPGVYDTWAECQAETNGFSGAKFKSFDARSTAEDALINGWDKLENTAPTIKLKSESAKLNTDYEKDSLSVDAACSGNPGEMEYQCVNTETGELIFASKIYPMGTNNLGEFLALVDALRHAVKTGYTKPIYTDSVSAIAWVRNRKVKTSLIRTPDKEELFRDIDLAIRWLDQNRYANRIIKWDTKSWGESKADFGRK